ncbi:MAG: hypothetical protein AAB688_00870 [Patescibacteria group bacterium]
MSNNRVAGHDLSLRKKFPNLLSQWKKEVNTSTRGIIYGLPAYKKIINTGVEVVPYILNEFKKALREKRDPDLLFVALIKITKEQPVKPHHIGNMKEMARSWIEWGEAKGYL